MAITTVLLTQDKLGMAVAALGQRIPWLVRLIERRRGKLATIWAQQSVDAVVDTALVDTRAAHDGAATCRCPR